jgi:Flp pilus assembly pilin Flp
VSSRLAAFWHDRSGATAIEYAFIALMISVTIIGALQLIAPKLISTFGNVDDGLNGI